MQVVLLSQPCSWPLFPHVSAGPSHLLPQKPCKRSPHSAVWHYQWQCALPGLWHSRDGVHPLWELFLRGAAKRGREMDGAQAHSGADAQASLLLRFPWREVAVPHASHFLGGSG